MTHAMRFFWGVVFGIPFGRTGPEMLAIGLLCIIIGSWWDVFVSVVRRGIRP